MKGTLKKFILFFSLPVLFQSHPNFSAVYSQRGYILSQNIIQDNNPENKIDLKDQEENIEKALIYFNNREYRANFKLFYAIPIKFATAVTKSSIFQDTGIIRLEIKSLFHHEIESCINIRTGKPLWHKWKMSSIFGKKDISAYFDNERGLIEYTKNDTKKTLSFCRQVYDPLSAMVSCFSRKIKKGKMEEGMLDMNILWYIGKIYPVTIDIKKEKDKFKVGIASNKKSSGYALFDENGRPLGGEGYAVPLAGHVSIYDKEFENKLKK